MTNLRIAVFGLIVGCSLSLPLPGKAELDPLVILNGRFKPAQSDRIRLDSARVAMRCGYRNYTIDSIYEFFNTGDTTLQWLGIRGFGSGRYSAIAPGRFTRFDVSVDGRKVPFTPQLEQSDDADGTRPHIQGTRCDESGIDWIVIKITFPGHTKTTVCVTYEVEHHWKPARKQHGHDYGPYPGMGLWWSPYWKDRIGKAEKVVDSSVVCDSKYPEFRPNEGVTQTILSDYLVRYSQEDFKPYPRDWSR